MTYRLSEPVENLIQESGSGAIVTDVVVVGSGYGGAIAALRLAHEDREVLVLERGEEYAPGDFPNGLGDVPGLFQFRRPSDKEGIGYPTGLFDLRFGDDVDVLVGSGLGGTSLINANVAAEPGQEIFRGSAWPRAIADQFGEMTTAYDEVRRLLGITKIKPTTKFEAVNRLAQSLHVQCSAAPIAVTLPEDWSEPAASSPPGYKNAVGVQQAPCTLCGNCVSGCNVGAKNTLAMNVIPLAKTRGARFFTGATVVSLDKSGDTDHPWLARYRRTATMKTPLASEAYEVRAKVVILAAGTLGSTEILLHSRDEGKLHVSPKLGSRFSTNGDGFAIGFAQEDGVNALGKRDQTARHDVGPTICGIASARVIDPLTGDSIRLTIEDAAIPFSILSLFGEIATTGAQLHRLGSTKLPAWLTKHGRADPLAVHRGALAHSQILMIMGDDGAGGRLVLTPDRSNVTVVWTDAARNPALRCADAMLASQDCKAGFDGGQYVPNPLWRPIAPEAEDVMSGTLPGGRVITVHPLGGCPMGECIEDGVVDDAGLVFSGEPGMTHYEGLYVLDGSIVPTALAVNPFLTIAALAWRASGKLLDRYGWMESAVLQVDKTFEKLVPDPQPIHIPLPAAETAVCFQEQLIGQLEAPAAALSKIVPRKNIGIGNWCDYNGLIMRVAMGTGSIERWLEDPGGQPLPARATLFVNPVPTAVLKQMRSFHVPDEHLEGLAPVVDAEGTVALLAREPALLPVRWWRAGKAIWAYLQRRGWSFSRDRRSSGTLDADEKRSSIWEQARGFLAVALMHADYRSLTYRFDGECGDYKVRIRGKKLLAWAMDNPRLLDSLLNLPVTITFRKARHRASFKGRLAVNMHQMATSGIPQVRGAPHLPAAVSAMGSIGAYFARAVLQTYFWDFGSYGYPDKPVQQNPQPRPLKVSGNRTIAPRTEWIRVPLARGDSRTVPIALTRYAQQAANAEPVLLIHGLAQGSLIYSTDSLDNSDVAGNPSGPELMNRNMAAVMWDAGYEVWLLDYRLSNAVIRLIPDSGWSMEEIAQFDIPAAVDHVYQASGNRAIRVFAHCVGATVIAMAVLRGWVDSAKFKKVAFNAIHPWILTSPVNRFRATLGTLFRDVVGSDMLDPIPQAKPSPAQALLDRIAFAFARYEEDPEDPHATDRALALVHATCDRMSFLYGRMWRHANLDERTHQAFLDMLGPSPGSVYRHLYYFSQRGRVTDREGQNIFLRQDRVRTRWKFPALFFHGESSQVFNPQSASESAIRMAWVKSGVVRPGEMWLKRVQDNGHMDIVFSRHAWKEVYPCLKNFFLDQPQTSPREIYSDPFSEKDSAHPLVDKAPRTGPILRAAWTESGAIHLRLWSEIHDASATTIHGLKVQGQDVRVEAEWRIRACEHRYRLVDVRLDPGKSEVAFSVVHDTAETPAIDFFRAGTQSPHAVLHEAISGNDKLVFSEERLPWFARLKRWAGDARPASISFLVGSCRYPGTPFERDAADAVFHGMLKHVSSGSADDGVDLLFLIGDQIYADATANILDAESWRERYSVRYQQAFRADCSPNLAQLVKRVPTHFALDDHEFVDDWPGLDLPHQDPAADKRHRLAKRAARSFQSSGRESRAIPGTCAKAGALWYPLDHECETACPCFVMDTRSERRLRKAGQPGLEATITDKTQWRALRDWLGQFDDKKESPYRDHPKFIFSASVIAPVSRDFCAHPELWRREDGWAGYPACLGALVRIIVEKQIQNVVFVGGDLHLSAFGRLTLKLDGHTPVTAWQIVSSGLYAPMPFANADPRKFDWNQECRIPIPGSDVRITANMGLLTARTGNFVRVGSRKDASWELAVSVHGAGGEPLQPVTSPPPMARSAGHSWVISLAGSSAQLAARQVAGAHA